MDWTEGMERDGVGGSAGDTGGQGKEGGRGDKSGAVAGGRGQVGDGYFWNVGHP